MSWDIRINSRVQVAKIKGLNKRGRRALVWRKAGHMQDMSVNNPNHMFKASLSATANHPLESDRLAFCRPLGTAHRICRESQEATHAVISELYGWRTCRSPMGCAVLGYTWNDRDIPPHWLYL